MKTLLLLIAAAWAVAASAAPETLTIRDAMDAALKNNPDVKSAREKINEMTGDLHLAVSTIFPVVTAGLSVYTKQDAPLSPFSVGVQVAGGGPYNNYQYNLTATQILFDGLAAYNGWRYALKQIDVSHYDEVVAERTVGLSVLQAYYTILLNQMVLNDLGKTRKVDDEVLVTAQQRYRIGRGQLLDVLNIKTQIALLEPQIAQARTQIENSAAQLIALMGDSRIHDIEVKGKLELPSWGPLIEKVEPQRAIRPELAQNRLEQDQFTNKIGMTLAPNYPQLNAIGVVSQNVYGSVSILNPPGWSVGLQLSIPLFSGLSYWNNRALLASQAEELRITEEKLVESETSDQIQGQKNLDLAGRQLESSREAVSLAEQSLLEAERNYKLATIDYIQFLQTQTARFQANISFDQTKYSALVALANYFIAFGYPMDELVSWLASVTGTG